MVRRKYIIREEEKMYNRFLRARRLLFGILSAFKVQDLTSVCSGRIASNWVVPLVPGLNFLTSEFMFLIFDLSDHLTENDINEAVQMEVKQID